MFNWKHILRHLQKDLSQHPWIAVLAGVALFAGGGLLGLENAVFLCIAILWVGYGWEIRPLILASCGLLLTIGVLLGLDQGRLAGVLGVWIYFLLCIAVITEIVDFLKSKVWIGWKLFWQEQVISRLGTFGAKSLDTSVPYSQNHKKQSLLLLEGKVQTVPQISKDSIYDKAGQVLVILICIYIFRFEGLPNFADLLTLPDRYNLNGNWLHYPTWQLRIFNLVQSLGLPPIWISRLFFSGLFAGAVLLNRWVWKKIHAMPWWEFTQSNQMYPQNGVSWIVAILLVFNPFTLERFWMGQYTVLIGHFCLLPVVYLIMRDWWDGEQIHSRWKFNLVLVSALSVLIFVSPHYGIMSITLWLAGCILWMLRIRLRQPYPMASPSWKILLLTVIIPAGILVMANIPNLYTIETLSSGQKSDIIRAFSLNFTPDSNPWITSLIGGGSWHSPTFYARETLRESLGFWQNFSLYFNPGLGIIAAASTLFLVVVCLFWSIKRSREFNPFLAICLIFIPISLLLNFGFSLGFEFINRWFYFLPGSYLFREAGKFYSLFLVLSVGLISVYASKIHRQLGVFAAVLGGILALGNVLTFMPISLGLNYVEFPRLFDQVSESCRDEDLVVYLPHRLYIEASYSPKSYIANPIPYLIDCKVEIARIAYVSDFKENGSVELFATQRSKDIAGGLSRFNDLSSNSEDMNDYIGQLKSMGVTILILDINRYYPGIQRLESLMQESYDPILEEGNLRVYRLN